MKDSNVPFSGTSRRQFLGAIAVIPFANSCEARSMKAVLNVILYNYLNRPIFDVFIDSKVGRASDAYPSTGGGMITGVSFDLGPKKVTWRLDGPQGTPRNGETVTNKNPLRLENIVQGAKFLGVHIYPDDTVELIASVSILGRTPRGIAMAQEYGRG